MGLFGRRMTKLLNGHYFEGARPEMAPNLPEQPDNKIDLIIYSTLVQIKSWLIGSSLGNIVYLVACPRPASRQTDFSPAALRATQQLTIITTTTTTQQSAEGHFCRPEILSEISSLKALLFKRGACALIDSNHLTYQLSLWRHLVDSSRFIKTSRN